MPSTTGAFGCRHRRAVQEVVSSISLNSNIASLNAQRRLGQSTENLRDSFARLSSGLRINKASDDAAGLAIASALDVDRRVFSQGVRNLNEGISLLSIADSALNELSNITIRLSELAEQSANGSLSTSQRKSLDEEAQALKDEYLRIAQSTEFNGQQVFAADFGELRLQAGFGEGGGVTSGLGGAIGDGSFGARTSYLTEVGTGDGRSYGVALGDLNGDGVLDMVTAGAINGVATGGYATVRLGTGDGSFGAATSYLAEDESAFGISRAVALGDLNNDGVLDLVTAGEANDGSSQGYATVRLGIGDGSFGAAQSYASEQGSSAGRSRAVALGDLNNDGVLDLVTSGEATSGSTQGYATVRLGIGDGSFGAATSLFAERGSSDGVSDAVVLGDLNGDGVLDLVTAGQADNGIAQGYATIRLGIGDGSFGTATSYATEQGATLGHSYSVTLGDLNGDGVLDLVTAGVANNGSAFGYATIRLGVGDGTFGVATSFETERGSIFGSSNSVALGDINGDGFLDLGTAGNAIDTGFQGFSTIRLGNGDGSFSAGISRPAEEGTASSYSLSLAFGDLDGDGVLDLVTAGMQETALLKALPQYDSPRPLQAYQPCLISHSKHKLTPDKPSQYFSVNSINLQSSEG